MFLKNKRGFTPFRDKSLTGFTLVELLVVIAVIGLLATIVTVSVNSARKKGRDAKRLTDVKQLITALAMYYDKYGYYPNSDFQGCGGWETPGDGDFISALRTEGFLSADVSDPSSNYDCGNYRYYRYPEGYAACDTSRGAYYVLGVVDMETSGNPYSGSPGWRCPNRNWQNEMEWATGSFEK